MKHLDLFSGIGGFALAARKVGWETVAFCESDEYCQAVLRKHWPDVPIHPDVRELTADAVGSVDIVTGGYPCQPFSSAGERRGAGDDRHLWPHFARLIRELRPRWAVGENVVGHVTMGLDDVLSDLGRLGYACETFVIPACAVDAHHRRERVWIVADANGQWQPQPQGSERNKRRWSINSREALPDSDRERRTDVAGSARPARTRRRTVPGSNDAERRAYTWSSEPDVGRVAHGIPARMDRLRALGNAIVPQVAEEIFRAIEAVR